MKRVEIKNRTLIKCNKSYEGKWLSTEIRAMIENNEPINVQIPVEYTKPQDGVLPQYDPRTDKREIMMESMDKATKQAKTNWMKKVGLIKAETNGEVTPE